MSCQRCGGELRERSGRDQYGGQGTKCLSCGLTDAHLVVYQEHELPRPIVPPVKHDDA